jgi:hypothetical protein
MAEYLLSIHMVEGPEDPPREAMTPEEMERSWNAIQALNEELKAEGAWIFGGALYPPSGAAVVEAQGEKVLVTDGPYAETKEQIAGFYILSATDLDAAKAWAAKTSAATGKPIEVRPFRDADM